MDRRLVSRKHGLFKFLSFSEVPVCNQLHKGTIFFQLEELPWPRPRHESEQRAKTAQQHSTDPCRPARSTRSAGESEGEHKGEVERRESESRSGSDMFPFIRRFVIASYSQHHSTNSGNLPFLKEKIDD
jgi:hypothetical protein